LVRCALLEKTDRELQMNAPEWDSYPMPEAVDGDESMEALFDTSGHDFDQLSISQNFSGPRCNCHGGDNAGDGDDN